MCNLLHLEFWYDFQWDSPEAQILLHNGMSRFIGDAHLVCKFSDHDSTILHHQDPQLVMTISCREPARVCFTFHWCAASFEAVVPLLQLCGAHCFIPEGLLDLGDHFHMRIGELYKKTVVVFMSFCQKRKSYSALYTSSLIGSLLLTHSFYRGKKFTHAHWGHLHMFTKPHFSSLICLRTENQGWMLFG